MFARSTGTHQVLRAHRLRQHFDLMMAASFPAAGETMTSLKLLLLTCVIANGVATADDLIWESTSLSVEPQTVNRPAMAVFRFRNEGSVLVRLSDIRSGCDCVVPLPDDASLAPQASGILRVMLLPEPSPNPVRRYIDVTVTGQSVSKVRLWLTVTWLDSLGVFPESLSWDGAEPDWRMLTLRVPLQLEMLSLALSSDHIEWLEMGPITAIGEEEDFNTPTVLQMWIRPQTPKAFSTWADFSISTPRGERAVRVQLTRP